MNEHRELYSEPVNYDEKEIASYLNELAEEIEKSNCSGPIHLELKNVPWEPATTNIHYNPQTKTWKLLQGDSAEELSLEAMAKKIFLKYRCSSETSIFNVSLMAANNEPHREQLTNNLNELRKNHLQQLSKTLNENRRADNFALRAAEYGHSDFVEALVDNNNLNKDDNNLNKDDSIMYWISRNGIQNNQIKVYELIKRKYTDQNTKIQLEYDMQSAKYAAEYGQLDCLKIILGGYPFLNDSQIISLANAATIAKHPNIVKFLREKYDNFPENKARDLLYQAESNFDLTHNKLIDLAKSLGYVNDQSGRVAQSQRGLCNGTTLSWLTACMLEDENIGQNRIEARITKIQNGKYGYNIEDEIQKVRNKIKNNRDTLLTEDDWDLLEIHPFFDNVMVQQDPSKFNYQLFPEAVHQQSFEKSSEVVLSIPLKEQGKLVNIYFESGCYSETELTSYLQQLANSIDELHYNGKVCFQLGNTKHAMGLTYNSKTKEWTLMDINQWPPRRRSSVADIANLIFKGFPPTAGNSFIAMNTTAVAMEKHPQREGLSQKLNKIKSDHFKQITLKTRLSKLKAPLAMIAATYGDCPLMQKLIHDPAACCLQDPEDGYTPAHMAAQNGHSGIIALLGEAGKQSYSSYTHKSINPVSFGRWEDSIDAFIPIKGFTPAQLAAFNGNSNVLTELARFDGIGNNTARLFFLAIARGHANVIAELGRLGYNLEKEQSITVITLAILAIKRSNKQVIMELKKVGAFKIPPLDANREIYQDSYRGLINMLLQTDLATLALEDNVLQKALEDQKQRCNEYLQRIEALRLGTDDKAMTEFVANYQEEINNPKTSTKRKAQIKLDLEEVANKLNSATINFSTISSLSKCLDETDDDQEKEAISKLIKKIVATPILEREKFKLNESESELLNNLQVRICNELLDSIRKHSFGKIDVYMEKFISDAESKLKNATNNELLVLEESLRHALSTLPPAPLVEPLPTSKLTQSPRHELPSIDNSTQQLHKFSVFTKTVDADQQKYTDIKTAVDNAVKKYAKWYEWYHASAKERAEMKDVNVQDVRIEEGRFTWFRHGKKGQEKAKELQVLVTQCQEECPPNKTPAEFAIDTINTLLMKPKTRYENHSFASFLLDELKTIKQTPWHELPFRKGKQYSQSALETRITDYKNAPKISDDSQSSGNNNPGSATM